MKSANWNLSSLSQKPGGRGARVDGERWVRATGQPFLASPEDSR